MTDAPLFTHQSFEEAREQAAESLGFVVSERITTSKGEVFEIPNPSLLDDDQQARYDQLRVDAETWDRNDEIPEVLNEDGTVKTPARPGALKDPERKDGELVHYNVQLAKAIFGDRYEAFKAAGGRASDLELHWSRMRKALADRRAVDSKSAQSGSDLADSTSADRG
jgi:putative intracellular protease/amidase